MGVALFNFRPSFRQVVPGILKCLPFYILIGAKPQILKDTSVHLPLPLLTHAGHALLTGNTLDNAIDLCDLPSAVA